MFGFLLHMLILFLCLSNDLCTQQFVDIDNNPATGYLINGIGAELLIDVHGNVRTIYGAPFPGGWGAPLPAIIEQSEQGLLDGYFDSYDCEAFCMSCARIDGQPNRVNYWCEGDPAVEWFDTYKDNLHHVAVLINCFGE